MPLKIVLKSKGIRQRVNPEWQALPVTKKVRIGAFRNATEQRCLVGLNWEGKIVTKVFIEGKETYAFLKTLAQTYAIPIEYLFEQKPFHI